MGHYIPVKMGFSQFPKDTSVFPDVWAKALGDVVLLTRNEHGGHFAATEHPEILAKDLRTMFSKGSRLTAVSVERTITKKSHEQQDRSMLNELLRKRPNS